MSNARPSALFFCEPWPQGLLENEVKIKKWGK